MAVAAADIFLRNIVSTRGGSTRELAARIADKGPQVQRRASLTQFLSIDSNNIDGVFSFSFEGPAAYNTSFSFFVLRTSLPTHTL